MSSKKINQYGAIEARRDLSSEVPDYWRTFLENLAGKPSKPFHYGFYATRLYTVGNGVTAPHPISTPDPNYIELARRAKYQGVTVLYMIIDKSGHPVGVRVARPTGFGLDDQAVETVKGWTFQPGEFKGEPVAVQVNVQVNFRLY